MPLLGPGNRFGGQRIRDQEHAQCQDYGLPLALALRVDKDIDNIRVGPVPRLRVQIKR